MKWQYFVSGFILGAIIIDWLHIRWQLRKRLKQPENASDVQLTQSDIDAFNRIKPILVTTPAIKDKLVKPLSTLRKNK